MLGGRARSSTFRWSETKNCNSKSHTKESENPSSRWSNKCPWCWIRGHCSRSTRSSHGRTNNHRCFTSTFFHQERWHHCSDSTRASCGNQTHEELTAKSGACASLIRFQEMVRRRDFSSPSTCRLRSTRLTQSLSMKSLSLRTSSLRNLSYSYSTGADGRIEMISNAECNRKNQAPDGYFFKLLKLNAPEWPYSIKQYGLRFLVSLALHLL